MTRFMEKGDDVVMGEQRWLAIARWREVAGQVNHRCLYGRVDTAARAFAVDPGTALLTLACVQIEHQMTAGFAVAQHFKNPGIVVPGANARVTYLDAKQGVGHLEQAFDDARFGEVLLDLVFRVGVAGFAKAFGNVGIVPGLKGVEPQLFFGKGFQRGQVALCPWFGTVCQFAQECQYVFGRVGHACFQSHVGKVFKAQKLCFAGAKVKQLFDKTGVVEGRVALIGRQGAVGTVKCFA